MSRRGARLTVAVLFALSAGAAAWQYRGAERALGSRDREADGFDREARAIVLAIADLRAAQQAYVAAGQGTEYWAGRVTSSLESLKNRIAMLRQAARSPEAATRLDAAAASLEDFARMDRRAREFALSGQRLLASDVIFADGFELARAVALDVDGARASERDANAAAAGPLENRKRLLAAGVAAVGLLFMLILASAPGRPLDQATHVPESDAASTPADMRLQPDLALRPEVPEPEPVAPPVDLRLAADLCVELARVTDTEQIPALLDRAARVLDASGIVLWIADPDGRELVPTVAHGYPAAAIARVGSIATDADNATAAAYREARVHIVKSDMLTAGAIAAPLVVPGGCIGVMAAEVRRDREQSEDVRALASIVAAQLAMLIGVAPAAGAQPKARAQ